MGHGDLHHQTVLVFGDSTLCINISPLVLSILLFTASGFVWSSLKSNQGTSLPVFAKMPQQQFDSYENLIVELADGAPTPFSV
jgi:hypothetical protein